MIKKYKMTTEYSGLSGSYFQKLLYSAINIGKLDRNHLRILDYGAGYGLLKNIMHKINKTVTVINFDIEPDLSDIEDWRSENFSVVVANQVFYAIDIKDLEKLLIEFKSHNANMELIVGISRQSLFNNIGKIIFGQPDAHKYTKTPPKEELATLLKYMDIREYETIWYLSDVYRLSFKK